MKRKLAALMTTTRLYLALLLALTLALAGPAMADEWTDANGDKWTYTVSNGVATITGHTGPGGDVTIPTTVDNGSGASYTVTQIGNAAFQNNTTLTKVTIPSSVTTIGDYAFELCTKLKDVTIPDGSKLTSIGRSAFLACYVLESVMIPQGVTSIATETFHRCESLKSVTIPDGSKLTSIASNAFRDCTSLTKITIPEGVTSIRSNAFRGCKSLESVTIPEGVTSIERQVFQGCSSLKDVTIPGSVTKIDDEAFKDSGLKTIDFGGTEAGWNAVEGTDAIPSGVTMSYKGWLVTLDASGGTPSQTTVRTDEDGKVVSLPTPARTGWTFKGWLDAREGKLCVSGAIFTSPTTLEAQWEAGVPATGVKLDEDALTLKEGGTATLTAKVSPEGTTDAVVWASTDPSVATVTDGKVKGIKAGAAVVTATAGGRMAFCLVTVTGEDGKPGPTPTSVELDEASLTLAVGNTATLKATVDPAGASVAWATSDPSVVSVSGGKVTAKKAGTAIITATAGGRLAFCVVTVTEDGKPAPGPGRIEAALVSGGEGEAHLVLSVGADGSPKAWALLRVWLELLSLEDGGIVHASAEPGDVFGAFMAVTDGEGLMTIDVDALTWADGPDRGKRASIPAGTYRIHLAGADESYAESVLGPTVILAATQGDGEGNEDKKDSGDSGGSGGGCDGLSLGGAALLALAGAATRRRR